MNEYTLAIINLDCQMIQTGKPCASLAIQDRYVVEVVNMVNNVKLKTHVECLAEGWNTIFIYRDEYMLEIIKALPDPKTKFDHWVLGKAFGYSDEAIKEFLQNIGDGCDK